MPVNIKGTPYKKVVERLNEFHEDHKDNKSIMTEIIQFKDGVVVIKAAVKIGDNVFTGHAYEEIGSSQVNETSALENGETSAIGRALASAGYAGSEFASADEVQNAMHKQKNYKPKAKTDYSNDNWRDELVGYKKEEKKHLTWRTLPEADLLWIIEDGPTSWRENGVQEHNARQHDHVTRVEEGISDKDIVNEKVSAAEMDDIFGATDEQ